MFTVIYRTPFKLLAFLRYFDWPPLLYFALAPIAGIVAAWVIGVLAQ